jgi:hypothetical protein
LSSYLRTSSRGRHPTLLLREGRTGMWGSTSIWVTRGLSTKPSTKPRS